MHTEHACVPIFPCFSDCDRKREEKGKERRSHKSKEGRWKQLAILSWVNRREKSSKKITVNVKISSMHQNLFSKKKNI